MKKISCRLRNLLFQRKIRVADLERETGIRRSTLDLMYQDKALLLDTRVLAKLCKYFDCTLQELIVLEEK